MTKMKISRRDFLAVSAAAGGGLMIGFHWSPASAANVNKQPWLIPTDKEGTEVNAWLTIDPSGVVTIRVPHTEQGQGALTSVPMMIAEELEVDWKQIRAVFADPNRHVRNNNEYVTMSTSGSNVVRTQHPRMFVAGANARDRLRTAAANAWGVPLAEVTAKDGTLSAGTRRGTYGEFATAAASVTLKEEPKIKKPDQWTLLGTAVQRLDIPVKVNGSAAYSIDTRLPNMVYAAVVCCPVPWGDLKSFNFDAVKSRPGVIAAIEMKKVPGKTGGADMQSGVAIVADSWYRAKTALDLMPIEWNYGPNAAVSTASLMELHNAALDKAGEVRDKIGGDVMAMLAAPGAKVVKADYSRPYETHMRMEPINATVSVTPTRVDVWTPSQDQAAALTLAAEQSGQDPKNVFVHTTFIGGAFGGGGGGNTAVTKQATEISKVLGRPVKVVWTREEDVRNDKQRGMQGTRFAAAIGPNGYPTAWHSRSAGVETRADTGMTDMPYKVPNRLHERAVYASHIPTATHRAPGTNQNCFMREQFVDEVAQAGGIDPLEWRLKMTEGLPSWQIVLKALKEKGGFRTDLPKGQGMGIAIMEDHASICAACATVSVTRRGQLTVEKVFVVINSGHVINPLNCTEQLEGAACWELGTAWFAGLDLKDGRFTNTNFDTYQLMRIGQMPPVEVAFALEKGDGWGGMGEPAGPPTPAAVANAVFDACGARVTSLPIAGEPILHAMIDPSRGRSAVAWTRTRRQQGDRPRREGPGADVQVDGKAGQGDEARCQGGAREEGRLARQAQEEQGGLRHGRGGRHAASLRRVSPDGPSTRLCVRRCGRQPA